MQGVAARKGRVQLSTARHATQTSEIFLSDLSHGWPGSGFGATGHAPVSLARSSGSFTSLDIAVDWTLSCTAVRRGATRRPRLDSNPRP